jgi:hypothetical protein
LDRVQQQVDDAELRGDAQLPFGVRGRTECGGRQQGRGATNRGAQMHGLSLDEKRRTVAVRRSAAKSSFVPSS